MRKQPLKLLRVSIHFKPQPVDHSEDCVCSTGHRGTPHESESGHLELNDGGETMEDKDKEYYFMDTTFLG